MAKWNKNLCEAPEYEPCWIYVPAYDYVAGSIVVAEFDGESWNFGEFSVENGEISDGEMIGPLAWMPITVPEAPEVSHV